MRILIVEDEEHLAIGLKFNFEAEGYAVAVAGDGKAALKTILDANPPIDLVVLDLMLPGVSGYDMCKSLRALNSTIPVLVLSARTLSEDRKKAFDCGADAYLTKPFDLPELLAKVRELLERGRTEASLANVGPASDAGDDTYAFANAVVNFRTFEVTVGGEPRKLTPTELQLLRMFFRNEGTVLSRAELLDKVWGMSPAPTTRTVDNFVMQLRKHFEIDAANPRHFLSVRGAGYRFVANPKQKK